MENNKPNNPYVFPTTDPQYFGAKNSEGITLRDYLANSAMQGICAHHNGFNIATVDGVAKKSYEIADAMLKQRENGK